jgi:malate synthase
MDVFNQYMPTPNQLHVKREDVKVTAQDLVAPPEGTITEEGLRKNINVGILYLESWLRGNGAAAIYNLMEDAATAEISRTQVWQWIKHKCKLDDGREVTLELYRSLVPSELEKIKGYVGADAYENGQFEKAIEIFDQLIDNDEFVEFLTLPAYELID